MDEWATMVGNAVHADCDRKLERLRQQNAALRDALEKTVQALEWGETRLPNSGHMMFGQPLIAARAALAQAEA